ncbi:hypothetical protein [Tateyamaria sp. SN3-11]|uniref:hypothetical protein n=1 Tax=Tateyamaria sp. SN3-11 TaxID=3092147 RepID=UPI0039ED014E
MTLITPGLEEARTEELFSSVQDSVRDLRQEFKTLKERVEQGEDVKVTEVKSKLSEVTTVMINCQKLETALADIRQKHSRIAQGGFALDLDAAKAEVRCALARVRPCCGTGEVSG